MKKTKSVNIFWIAGLFSKNTGMAADLLVAEESMAGLGSVAAGATSISTISLVDMEVESFPPYIYVPTPYAKHTKTTVEEPLV
jgi:hypothetical protein